MEKSDSQLVASYLSGDEESFGILVNRHLKLVYNFAFRLTGNAADAEDVAQETFFKVWKNLKKFRQNENFRAWTLRIARNTAFDLLRKRKDRILSEFEGNDGKNYLLEELADTEPLAYELLSQAEDKKMVGKLLEKLPPVYREVLMLRYSSDFTFDEIGHILGKPLHTVKSQHRRALLLLKKFLISMNELQKSPHS